jgi:hypothetical protein
MMQKEAGVYTMTHAYVCWEQIDTWQAGHASDASNAYIVHPPPQLCLCFTANAWGTTQALANGVCKVPLIGIGQHHK